jgi:hypothetical protein
VMGRVHGHLDEGGGRLWRDTAHDATFTKIRDCIVDITGYPDTVAATGRRGGAGAP